MKKLTSFILHAVLLTVLIAGAFLFLEKSEVIAPRGALPAEIDDVELAHVVYVIDGDTFELASGERVRLLGIDTPERGERCYREASEKLAELVARGGGEVSLAMGESDTDKYGRLLRHVFSDDVHVNRVLVAEGYARTLFFSGQVAYREEFKALEEVARTQHSGCLWQL